MPAPVTDLVSSGHITEHPPMWIEGKDGWTQAVGAAELRAAARTPDLRAAVGTPSPSPRSRVAFEPIFRAVQWAVASLTLAGVLLGARGTLMETTSYRGYAAAVRFVFDFIVAGGTAALINVIVVGLPVAGLIYFFRNRSRRG